MREISLDKNPIRGRGGQLHFSLGERAKVDADYYRIDAGGKRNFAGWAKWNAYVGLNEIRFGGRGEALPGRSPAVTSPSCGPPTATTTPARARQVRFRDHALAPRVADPQPPRTVAGMSGGGARRPRWRWCSAAIVSVQSGAAVATELFDEVGPVGTVMLRLVFAAIVLVAIWRPALAALRGAHARRRDRVRRRARRR